jgi:hypothetical protein
MVICFPEQIAEAQPLVGILWADRGYEIFQFSPNIRVLKPNGYELSGARQRVRSNEGLGRNQVWIKECLCE